MQGPSTTELDSDEIVMYLREFNEVGQNLFVDDDGLNFVLFKKLSDECYFQFAFNSHNSPAVEAGLLDISTQELIEHIHTHCSGWYARKCQLDINLDTYGYVVAPS